MHQSDEERLKILQTLIPDATHEKLKAFEDCMRTDALYKCALPCGVAGTLISRYVLSNRLGAMKNVISFFFGCTAYVFGRIIYAPVCKEKIFGPGNIAVADRVKGRRSLHDNFSNIGSFAQQNQPTGLAISTDKLLEDDSSWSNFDPFLDSNVSHFNTTDSGFQGEVIGEEPMNVQKHVTYDDLWAQHRESQMKEQYKDFVGSRPRNKERPTVPAERVAEKPEPPEMTHDGPNVWG